MKIRFIPLIGLMLSMGYISSCSDEVVHDMNKDITSTLPNSPEEGSVVARMNNDIKALMRIVNGEKVSYFSRMDGKGCTFAFDDDTSFEISINGESKSVNIPIAGIDKDGFWTYLWNNEILPLTDSEGNTVKAVSKESKAKAPQFRLNIANKWEVSFGGNKWNMLNDIAVSNISSDYSDYTPFASYNESEDGATIQIILKSDNYTITSGVIKKTTTEAWNKFTAGASDNLLLDFSYAGYKHAEVEAPSVASLKGSGYVEENVREYMNAHPELSARDAFLQLLKKHQLTRIDEESKAYQNPEAKVIFYFPEGEYILHSEADNTNSPNKKNPAYDSKGNNTSNPIGIYGGHFVIKGDGKGKTKLIMDAPNLPTDKNILYSSPTLLNIKHNSGFGDNSKVTSDSPKGTFSITVDNASKFSVGEWVALTMKNNDPILVAQELAPFPVNDKWTGIVKDGVQVQDYHQIEKIEGDVVTFKEPLMYGVEKKWGWYLRKYPHYEEIGIEDLTFVGKAKPEFIHHGTWDDDGGYKPVNMQRVTNSWMRRVEFTSISEACSVTGSANVSVYDIDINGFRGHSAIRSAGSSRVFMGKIKDFSDGINAKTKAFEKGVGQFHSVGVSKPSMGAVIWNVSWGSDACFEAHATQPRATLIDNCSGAFFQGRHGGAESELPNHLGDLTVWNFYATHSPQGAGFNNWGGWKIHMPLFIGFHGEKTNFNLEQVKLDESNGVPVEPRSLYEAQLEKRRGQVPAWLKALK